MKKKLLFMTLVMSIVFSVCALLTTTAFAAALNGTVGDDNLNWVLEDNGTLTISGTGAMPGDDYFSAYPWDELKDSIESIVIADGVTSVGFRAFEKCYNLTSITMADTVTRIESTAFYECTSLESITIPDSVEFIGGIAFCDCTKLNNIKIGSGVKEIENQVFLNTAYWKNSANYEDGVLYLGEYLIYVDPNVYLSNLYIKEGTRLITWDALWAGCDYLTELTLPESLKYIGGIGTCPKLKKINWNARNLLKSGNLDTVGKDTNGVEVIFGNNVETITGGAFADSTKLSKVVISESVTSIGDYAFRNCTQLTQVILPDNVKKVGKEAFSGCTGLTEIMIHENITTLGDGVFRGCTGLKNIYWNAKNPENFSAATGFFYGSGTAQNAMQVIVADGVKKIPDAAFRGSYLNDIILPESITSIGKSAFWGCTELKEIMIPESVTSIGTEAFYGCSGLTEITIPENVTVINEALFSQCTGLTSVSIPEKITSIEKAAFMNCSSLPDIVIPETVTAIGESAFSNCSSLTEITMPNSVLTLGGSAFSNCSGLNRIKLSENLKSLENSTFDKCTLLSEITLPESLTIIGQNVFKKCTSLTEVNLENITDLGLGTFSGCTNLSTVVLPKELQILDSYLFSDCTNLVNITIPETVTSIGVEAFLNCKSLKKITIPAKVSNIGRKAFNNCTGLETIIWYPKSVPDFEYGVYGFSSAGSEGGGLEVIFGDEVERIPAYAFYNLKNLKKVVISKSVTSVADQAFRDCTGLTTVILEDGLQSIGSSMFSRCTGLTTINIPDSVTSIGNGAFSGCSALTDITIGKGVNSIGNQAFSGCTGLERVNWNAKSVADFSESNHVFSNAGKNGDGLTVIFENEVETIPAYAFYPYSTSSYAPKLISVKFNGEVKNIGKYAFYKCSNLNSVYVNDLRDWLGIVFNGETSNPLYYGAELYVDGKILTDVTIPENVTSIGDYAFYCYTGLTNLNIPDNVTSIGYRAFSSCTALTEVIIGKGIETIGEQAFYGCTGLKKVNLPDTLKTLGSYLFSECTGLTTIDLPDGLENLGEYSFKGCTGLTSVDLPESLENLGKHSFSGCTSLKSITIPKNVKSIGNGVFYNCTGLESINWNTNYVADFSSRNEVFYKAGKSGEGIVVTFGENVERIPAYAFCPYTSSSYSPKILTLKISDSVNSVGDNAFNYCSAIKDVYYEGSEAEWNEISISSGNTYLTSATIHYNSVIDNGTESEKGTISFAVRGSSAGESTGGGTITVTSKENIEGTEVIAAIYQGEKLIGFESVPFDIKEGENTINCPITDFEDADTIKIMIWDDINNLTPLFGLCEEGL